jgi:murein DD-endopeptidase MepM/ murein hydrolase activator NlpD
MTFDRNNRARRLPRTRRLRVVRIGFVAGAALLAVVAGIALMRFFSKQAAPRPSPAAATALSPPAEPKASRLTITEVVIKKGQTLSDLLRADGFSAQDVDRLKDQVLRQTSPAVNLGRIVAGHRMRFAADADGRVQTIEYGIDDDEFLTVARDGTDFKAARKKYPYETRAVGLWGTVEDNVVRVIEHKGETDEIAVALADLFAWDIDFNTELRVGDAFRMVFEKKYLDGRFVRYGDILAAEFICQGKTYEAFRFEYPDTKKADHFDGEGKSVRKEFLRSPLPFGVTSGFSSRRLHPILKIYTAHYGVDFGAPRGYPVRATADGTVTFAGPNGPAGNMATVSHKNGYETMYLHLEGVAVKKGDRVIGGKTILGRVGSTGESTGPHLDYRIKQYGSYLNPLSRKFLPVDPLRPEFKQAFADRVVLDRLLLDAPLLVMRLWPQ